MRSWFARVRPFALVVLLGLASRAVQAEDATPAADEAALLRVSLNALAPDDVAVVGVTRTTYDPGGSLRLVAGAGPALLYVETGSLMVSSPAPPAPLVLAPLAPGAPAASPVPLAAGADQPLATGSALLLPAGGSAEIRNDADEPAATLDLIAATDAALEAETGVAHAQLARRQVTLPPPPVAISLARVTIAGGKRLEMPPAPVLTVAATIDPGQTFLLTGQSFNRGNDPVPVYVLSIAPAGAEGGTPTP